MPDRSGCDRGDPRRATTPSHPTACMSSWSAEMHSGRRWIVVPGGGIEPPFQAPKARVLPLDDPGAGRSARRSPGDYPAAVGSVAGSPVERHTTSPPTTSSVGCIPNESATDPDAAWFGWIVARKRATPRSDEPCSHRRCRFLRVAQTLEGGADHPCERGIIALDGGLDGTGHRTGLDDHDDPVAPRLPSVRRAAGFDGGGPGLELGSGARLAAREAVERGIVEYREEGVGIARDERLEAEPRRPDRRGGDHAGGPLTTMAPPTASASRSA